MGKKHSVADVMGSWKQPPELFNVLSKITWRRGVNAAKLLGSYYLSRFIGRPVIRGQPVSVSIEPTTHCNLRCPHCPSGLRAFTRPTGMISQALFRQIIDEMHVTLMYLILYFQGEPYLHPEFTELVQYAAGKNIYTATSTNGHYLNRANAERTVRSGLDRLIISIDGMEEQTYQKYRIGGRLHQVMQGIDALIRAKAKFNSSRPYIEAQFIVFSHNEHEVDAFKKMCIHRGIKPKVKTAQLYEKNQWEAYVPGNETYSRYTKDQKGVMSIKNKLFNHCWKMWHSAVVTWDGRVVPCCFDKDAGHVMGHIDSEGFTPIWNNRSYYNFRARLLQNRKNIEICSNCTEGTKVWL